MNEIYKPIEGFEELYLVSNTGKVKSIYGNTIRKQYVNNLGYCKVCLYKNKKMVNVSVHRLVANAFLPKNNTMNIVDHVDGNKQNNNASNLRWCTSSQNHMNTKKTKKGKSSKYKGVSYSKSRNKWEACIRINKKTIHLGRFSTEEEAGKAYDEKAKELFGEYAKLNFS
jgi:hypothetical protein